MSFASLTAGHSAVPTWTQVRYAATGVLVALALLLVVRRLAGALVVPLSAMTATDFAILPAWLVLAAEWNPQRGFGPGAYLPRMAATIATLALPTASLAALLGKFGWVPLVLLVRLLPRRRTEEKSPSSPRG